MFKLIILILIVLFCTKISATPTVVLPTDPTFEKDAQEFNFAPTLALKIKTNNTKVSEASAVYFCHDEQDVEDALLQILFSGSSFNTPNVQVRSGRHSYLASASTNPNSVILDVSNLTFSSFKTDNKKNKNKKADPVPYSSVCEGGESCTLIDIPAGVRLFDAYAFLATNFNMTFPGGSCPSVGASGFLLGGGISLYSRWQGLGAQNIYGAKIAQVGSDRMVSWKTVSFSSSENLDLLWALRGGGNGNFGVVTSITLRIYPKPKSASFLHISVPSNTASVIAATLAYQQYLTASRDEQQQQQFLCNITVTLYYYHQGAALVVLSTEFDYETILKFAHENFIKTIPGSNITSSMQNEQSWIQALSEISGCADVHTCFQRSERIPGYNTSSIYGPQWWTAFSVFSNRSDFTPAELTPILNAINAPLSIPTCNFFPVLIVDSLGCRVSKNGKLFKTSFPWTDALFHVQILAYNNPPAKADLSNQEILTCQNSIQDYAKNIFSQYDSVLKNYPASYRNYPNLELPNALERYYGVENLKKLKEMVKEYDPLKVFSNYKQGLGN